MASKNFNFGDSSTTVNVTATGNIVGENIKSKGDASTPIYFDEDGIAQACSDIIGSGKVKDVKVNQTSVLSSDGVAEIDLTGKQDKLIAGTNITIGADGKTISASGGGGSVDYLTIVDGKLCCVYEGDDE